MSPQPQQQQDDDLLADTIADELIPKKGEDEFWYGAYHGAHEAIIRTRSKDREALQAAADALGVTQHIWSCEDEAISSGQPSKEDYLNARDKVDAVLSLLSDLGITPKKDPA